MQGSISAIPQWIKSEVPVQIQSPSTLDSNGQKPETLSEKQAKGCGMVFPRCQTEQLLEVTVSKVVDVTCWSNSELIANTINSFISVPRITELDGIQSQLHLASIPTDLHVSRSQAALRDFHTSVHSNRKRMDERGIQFAITPMQKVPRQKYHSYCHAVLKKCGKTNEEVTFLGVCRIPPAPIRLKSLHKGKSHYFAVGVITGAPETQLGLQVWILYKVKETGSVHAVRIPVGTPPG